jgi:hypothetical protein
VVVVIVVAELPPASPCPDAGCGPDVQPDPAVATHDRSKPTRRALQRPPRRSAVPQDN